MALTITGIFGLQPGQATPAQLPLAGFGGAWLMELTGDTSYPTGGYTVPVPTGMTVVTLAVPVCTNAIGLIPYFTPATGKIGLYYPTGGSTVPGALALPTVTTGGTAVTSSAATAPLTAGQGAEVANTSNVSTVKIYAIVVGH